MNDERTGRFQSTLPRGSDLKAIRSTWASGLFQSTLPRGSDAAYLAGRLSHAPFQSTLPRGSDGESRAGALKSTQNFNPRSLAGATADLLSHGSPSQISIHAPSRERPASSSLLITLYNFNPRSLAGATVHANSKQYTLLISIHAPSRERLLQSINTVNMWAFQSTLPRGSDSIKMMYFYNYVNQAFVANKLN